MLPFEQQVRSSKYLKKVIARVGKFCVVTIFIIVSNIGKSKVLIQD